MNDVYTIKEAHLHLPHPEATRRAGQALGRALPADAIVLLEGDLGAGKTTLAKAICEALGVRPELVTSPTYTLANVYPGSRSVYHVDLYRLESPEALLNLDEDDWLNPEGVTLIEWPDHARPLLSGRPVLTLRLALDTGPDAPPENWPDDAARGPQDIAPDTTPGYTLREGGGGRRLYGFGDTAIYGAALTALEGTTV